MTMRINDAALQQVLAGYKQSGLGDLDKSQRGAGPTGKGQQGDQISISPEALSLQRVIRSAQDAPDVRNQRVEEIRTQMRTGSYVLNTNAIANKMLGLVGE